MSKEKVDAPLTSGVNPANAVKDEIDQIVARCVLFHNLDSSVRQQAIYRGHEHRFQKGETLFNEGEAAEGFYIVLEGTIKLIQVTPEGHQITIAYVQPGHGLGIIVSLSQTVYPVTAVAVQDSHVLGWGQNSLQALMHDHPGLALNGMNMIARYFVQLQNRYRELCTERVERRIARALLRLARQQGKKVPEGILINLPLSRQDLAEMTGTTLYTVSRTLSGWEKKGFVMTGREQVTISAPHQLVCIADDLPE